MKEKKGLKKRKKKKKKKTKKSVTVIDRNELLWLTLLTHFSLQSWINEANAFSLFFPHHTYRLNLDVPFQILQFLILFFQHVECRLLIFVMPQMADDSHPLKK